MPQIETLYYLHDVLGSVIGLADPNGDVVERYVYDPYGRTAIEQWDGSAWSFEDTSLFDNPYMWTGQRYDTGVGLYHFFARSYSPRLGRWLQRDPAGYVDGPNLFQYVGGRALSAVDPLGFWGVTQNLKPELPIHFLTPWEQQVRLAEERAAREAAERAWRKWINKFQYMNPPGARNIIANCVPGTWGGSPDPPTSPYPPPGGGDDDCPPSGGSSNPFGWKPRESDEPPNWQNINIEIPVVETLLKIGLGALGAGVGAPSGPGIAAGLVAGVALAEGVAGGIDEEYGTTLVINVGDVANEGINLSVQTAITAWQAAGGTAGAFGAFFSGGGGGDWSPGAAPKVLLPGAEVRH